MALTATVTDLDPGRPLAFPGNAFPYQSTGDFTPSVMKLLRITLAGTYETSGDALAVTVDALGGVSALGVIHGPLVAADESEVVVASVVPTLGGLVLTFYYNDTDPDANRVLGAPASADTLDDYYVDCIVFGTPSTYANG